MELRSAKQNEQQIAIVKLATKNVEAWKQSLQAYLCLKGLKEFIIKAHVGDSVPEGELQARIAILSSLNEDAQEKVQGCISAHSMYERIITIYSAGQSDNADFLLRKLFSMKKDPNDSITEHFTKMDGIRMCLERTGTPIIDKIFMNQVILSLPGEYSVMADIWDSLPDAQKTASKLLATICRQEAKLKDSVEADSKALVAKKLSIKERKRITHCAKCGLKGHWAKECQTKPEDFVKRPKDGQSSGDYAL